MKFFYSVVIAFFAFGVGLWVGVDEGARIVGNRCESVVVESILSGNPFMFMNDRPVVVVKRVRPDRSVVYRAMSEEVGDVVPR